MRHWFFITTLLLLPTVSFGQVVKRLENETAEKFANRMTPDSSFLVPNQVIETDSWDTGRKIVIAFYEKTTTRIYSNQIDTIITTDTIIGEVVTGFLFVRKEKQLYQKILIDTFNLDYEVESVFFANADTDSDLELCILLSVKPDEYVWKFDGFFYYTNIYDKPNFKMGVDKLNYLKDISEKFGDSEGTVIYQGGSTAETKAKFDTAAAVKKELKRLGYH